MNESQRNPALDLVRIVATFNVLLFHFLFRIDILSMPIQGTRIIILCFLREISMICVPVFIILTGYLMRKKQLSSGFYRGAIKTISIYILTSIVIYIYRVLKKGDLNEITVIFKEILDFNVTSYAWYIEMYIGLFMLIPFLNCMYQGGFLERNSADAVKYKRTLIMTLIILTALPQLGKGYLPEFWLPIYPLCYYLIGCYLSEYGLQLSRKTTGLLFLASALGKTIISIWRANGGPYVVDGWQEWGSILQVLQAVFAFSFLSTWDLSELSPKLNKLLRQISDLCLGAYLVSYIFDGLSCNWVRERVLSFGMRLNYLPLVFSNFVCSLLLSAFVNWIYQILANRFLRFKQFVRH